jgi:hypothetical protein
MWTFGYEFPDKYLSQCTRLLPQRFEGLCCVIELLCHSDLWAVIGLSEILSPSSALFEDSRFYKNVNQYPQSYKVLQIITVLILVKYL